MTTGASSIRVLVPAHIVFPSTRPEGELFQLSGTCMGTSWQVRVLVGGQEQARQLHADIGAILERIEAQMSHFRASSELCRFAQVPAGDWMALSPEFAQVMRAALDVARLSEGAFDPALSVAIEAWGFGARNRFSETGFVPPGRDQATMHSAWSRLQLDEQGRLLQPGGVSLNLAAIAKGFAVDAVSASLTRRGLGNHLVEVGGELRGAGLKPDGQPWWVALESPAAEADIPPTRLALHGLAVASSGNYRRHYVHEGQSRQHTIDPHTGAPVAHRLASVTVIHEECMYADAWATAIMVRGPQAGLELAEAHGLLACLQWQDENGIYRDASSSAFQALQQ